MVAVLVPDEKLNCFYYWRANFFNTEWVIFYLGPVEPPSGWWLPISLLLKLCRKQEAPQLNNTFHFLWLYKQILTFGNPESSSNLRLSVIYYLCISSNFHNLTSVKLFSSLDCWQTSDSNLPSLKISERSARSYLRRFPVWSEGQRRQRGRLSLRHLRLPLLRQHAGDLWAFGEVAKLFLCWYILSHHTWSPVTVGVKDTF